MLKYRIITGGLLLGLVAGMTMWAPTWAMVLLFLLITGLATLETVGLVSAGGFPALKWTSLVLASLWILAAWMASAVGDHSWLSVHLYWIMPGVTAWAIFLGCLFRSDQSESLNKIAGSFLTVAYAPGLLQFFVLLLFCCGEDVKDGRMLLVFGILVTKFTDIGAFFTGSAIGKHKLIPRISPAKTWEGVAGGVVVCTIVGVVFMSLMDFSISGISFTLFDAVALSIILGVSGILGDLVESMLKRAAGIKDSGSWVRGMGGVLDVLDSLMFALPILYVYVQWILLR